MHFGTEVHVTSLGDVMHCHNWAKPVHVLAGLLNNFHTGNGRVCDMDGCGPEHDRLHAWLCQQFMRRSKLI
jgi:hypothetical protein